MSESELVSASSLCFLWRSNINFYREILIYGQRFHSPVKWPLNFNNKKWELQEGRDKACPQRRLTEDGGRDVI